MRRFTLRLLALTAFLGGAALPLMVSALAGISITQPPPAAFPPVPTTSDVIMRRFTSGGTDYNTNISHTTYPVASIASFAAAAGVYVGASLIANGDGFWHVTSTIGFTSADVVFYTAAFASRNF